MKQLILLTLFLAKISVCISQYTDSLDGLSAYDYLVKSKNQKAGAVMLTVAGSIGLAVTYFSYTSRGVVDLGTSILSLGTIEPKRRSYTVPYLLSAAAIVGAIPLYASAAKNKNTYYMISAHVKFEERSVLQQNTINPITYPALALKVKLR